MLDLGEQALTGVFPSSASEQVPTMPLVLVKCHGNDSCCHLLQLAHTFDLSQLYGENYGYRSRLNGHIESHLKHTVEYIESIISLGGEHLVLDIGSNDGTTLGCYKRPLKHRVGIDPTANKFAHYYPSDTKFIAEFFSKETYTKHYKDIKATVITAFSMFYDLEDPVSFAKDVADILDSQGIWVLEQSYMPTMLQKLSYDTICHEHLEYYGLRQIKWIMDKVGLDIIDVSFNELNGGSVRVTVAHKSYQGEVEREKVQCVLREEAQYKTLAPFKEFAYLVRKAADDLFKKLQKLKSESKRVVAIGASTKGNVILQYCRIDDSLLDVVGEVNENKYQKFTPGSLIPIQPEDVVLRETPDYLLILPWHLWRFFENNHKFSSFKLLYPVPISSRQ